MQIEELRVDDADTLAAVVEVLNAANAVDAPWLHPVTTTSHRGDLTHGWDGEVPRPFVGRVDGRVVSYGEYHTSEWDNVHVAWLDFVVHPEQRRLGFASALLDHLLGVARADGRTIVGTWHARNPAGTALVERHGFELKSTEVDRRQVLADVDLPQVERLLAAARQAAGGYELVRVERGTPDHLLPAVAELTAAINDAPTDDLDVEDEQFPVDRIRSYEAAQAAKGGRLYRLIARHHDSGALAGHTVVVVDGHRPHLAGQHDTAVARHHRGHRLGFLLKASMLAWLADAEPQIEVIDTGNAASNSYMISVNEQLGYRPVGEFDLFQRAL